MRSGVSGVSVMSSCVVLHRNCKSSYRNPELSYTDITHTHQASAGEVKKILKMGFYPFLLAVIRAVFCLMAFRIIKVSNDYFSG